MITALPKGWAWATVDDLAKYVNGLAFKPSDWEQSGRPIIRIQNLTGKTDFNHTTRAVPQDVVVREGDILVSWSATLDVFVWRGSEAVLNQHIFKVIPASHFRDHVFLKWALKNAIEELWASEHSHGTTMKHVNRGPFLAHRVRLPPDAEQRRIADAIESCFTQLDDAVATLERVQRNLKRYRASVLKAAVEGRLVPTEAELARAEGRSYEPASVLLERILVERRRRWEEAELAKMAAKGKVPNDDKWKAKYVEPVAPDTSELPELPEGWCWTNLDLLKAFSLYGPRFSSDDYASDGRLVLRTSDISESGKVDLASAPRLHLDDEEFAKYRVEQGDLLVTRTGSLGTLAVFNDTVDAIAGAYLIQFRLVAPLDTSWFCFNFLKSPTGQARLKSGGAGVGRPNLNAPTIEAITIGLPPQAEQSRILIEVERLLSVADVLDDAASANRARLTRLRQSILKCAFEGRLVDQDPTDEPASVLLERIRAERGSANGNPTRRPRRTKARTSKS